MTNKNNKGDLLVIYTDGSCKNYKDLEERAREGGGGWGVVVVEPRTYLKGYAEPPQTNQSMELLAILEALKWIIATGREKTKSIQIYSDSMYAIGGLTSGQIDLYAEFDFDVPNGKVWRELHKIRKKLPRIVYFHVKGHAGNKFNHMADRMASEARKSKGVKT